MVPYLYISGASYCGSTLLAFLLNSHPAMASISEAEGLIAAADVNSYTCSCGALLPECPFYSEVEHRIRELGSSFELANWRTAFRLSRHRLVDIALVRPLRSVALERIRDRVVPLFPNYRRAIRDIERRNTHLARAVLEIAGKRVFVDAQKDSIRLKFLQAAGDFDLRAIHLVRDVRGAASSFLKHSGTSAVTWAARAWRNANMNSERSRRYVPPDRWLRLRYDDLCADVQGTMDRISDFAGVERAAVPQNFYAVEHHIIGNEMRLERNPTIRKDESWKKRFTPADLEIIARVAGRENRYFGYTWPE